MAQQTAWLDGTHFAVGRWNGAVSVFDASDPHPRAPVLDAVLASPQGEGIQMLAAGDGSWFVSSNDSSSLSVWKQNGGVWSAVELWATPSFNPSYGVATSGLYVSTASGNWLATGHDAGYLLIWDASDPSSLTVTQVVNLTSSQPTNPWKLQTIRQIALLEIAAGQAVVATGSENGSLALVSMPSGTIIDSIVYNPAAKRGLNTVNTMGNWILAGNCAVGSTDSNLWCYDTSSGAIVNTDSTNLVVDTSRAQVFNFSISSKPDYWYSATEEGALWGGTISASGQLNVAGYEEVSASIGAATSYGGPNELVVAAYDIHSYNPTERLPLAAYRGRRRGKQY